MDENKINITKCPACGAPLDPHAHGVQKNSLIICKYCNTRFKADSHLIDKPENSVILKKIFNCTILFDFLKKKKNFLICFSITCIIFFILLFIVRKPDYEVSNQIPKGKYQITGSKNPGMNNSSVNGKYSNLIQIVNCPKDRDSYGSFYDYGYWGGKSWCGKKTEPGYWVWIDPDWHVWKDITADKDKIDPSVNGKYYGLLQVVKCPGDRENYGSFQDYGYWNGGKWCGEMTRAGFWVWVDPNWHIWHYRKE